MLMSDSPCRGERSRKNEDAQKELRNIRRIPPSVIFQYGGHLLVEREILRSNESQIELGEHLAIPEYPMITSETVN